MIAIPLRSAAEKFKCKANTNQLDTFLSSLEIESNEQQKIKTWKGFVPIQTPAVGKTSCLYIFPPAKLFISANKLVRMDLHNIEIYCHSLWRFWETVWRQNGTKYKRTNELETFSNTSLLQTATRVEECFKTMQTTSSFRFRSVYQKTFTSRKLVLFFAQIFIAVCTWTFS